MEKAQTMSLNGKDYPVKFTYSSFRLLGTFWKLNTVNEVLLKISKALSSVGENGLTFEQEDTVADLIWSGIADEEISREEILNSGIMLDAEQLEKVFNLFSESFAKLGKPKATPQPKPKSRKK